MSYRFYILLIPFLLFPREALSDEMSPPERSITLKQAVDHALKRSPQLAAMGHQVDADTARLEGNEGYPNPSLSVEVEDFLGSGIARGADSLQVTTALSQDVPLGGKPGARRQAKTAQKEVSIIEYQIAEQMLVSQASLAFLDVLAHQRRLVNAGEMVALAEETVKTFEIQVEAGRATAIEVDKAAIVLSLASLAKERAERALVSAKQRLSSACGESTLFFDEAAGSLDHIEALPSLADLLKRVDRHPSLLARIAETRHRQALLELEKANRAPDLSFSLGYRWINGTADSALVAGVAVPLPFVDRNQGPIGAASHNALKSEKASDQERVTLIQSLTEAFYLLASEHKRAIVLQEEVYPKVISTFEAITEGYRLGRFGYLDLLDAQRTLFEVKDQALEAVIAYHRTAIHLNQTAALPIAPTRFEQNAREQGVKP